MNGWKIFFLVVLTILLVLFLLYLNTNLHGFGLGFDSKREVAEKIYSKIGNVKTRDLRYDDFINSYPEGDNALYTDIKKLNVVDIDGLMSVL